MRGGSASPEDDASPKAQS